MTTQTVSSSFPSRQISNLTNLLEGCDIYAISAALNNPRGTPLYSEALTYIQEYSAANKIRMNIFSADGSCVLDTNKSTFDNNNPVVILHDNGFLRSSVNRAMLSPEIKFEHEVKYSNTTKETDAYVAVRLGPSPSNIFGAVRVAQLAVSMSM